MMQALFIFATSIACLSTTMAFASNFFIPRQRASESEKRGYATETVYYKLFYFFSIAVNTHLQNLAFETFFRSPKQVNYRQQESKLENFKIFVNNNKSHWYVKMGTNDSSSTFVRFFVSCASGRSGSKKKRFRKPRLIVNLDCWETPFEEETYCTSLHVRSWLGSRVLQKL